MATYDQVKFHKFSRHQLAFSFVSWRAMACLIMDSKLEVRAKFRIYSPDLQTWVAIYPKIKTQNLQAMVEDIKYELQDAISFYKDLNISLYRAFAEHPKGQELPDVWLVYFNSWIYVKSWGDGFWDGDIPDPVSVAASGSDSPFDIAESVGGDPFDENGVQ